MGSFPEECVDIHRRNNRQSANCWSQFTPHRAKLTELIRLASKRHAERLLVLGAGNCNDLDVPALVSQFDQVTLADIDQEALRRAKDKQLPELAASLTVRAPLDLSGALALLPGYRTSRPSSQEIAGLVESCANAVTEAFSDTFDTVVSACLLSQIMVGCRLALGPDHPDLDSVSGAVATAHLQSLVSLVRPGGSALLVSDVCSTSNYPALEDRLAQLSPADVLPHLEATNNVFLGTRPSKVLEALMTAPTFDLLASGPQLVEPWLWRMGPLDLLVYAVVLRRRES